MFIQRELRLAHIAELRVSLAVVIYHCDLEARFHSMREFIKHDGVQKGRKNRANDKLAEHGKRAVNELGVYQSALTEFVREVLEPGVFYSVGRNVFQGMQSMQSYLDQPATKWRRLDASQLLEDSVGNDIDNVGRDDAEQLVDFQVQITGSIVHG